MIASVDEREIDGCARESACGSQAAEAAADDVHARPRALLVLQDAPSVMRSCVRLAPYSHFKRVAQQGEEHAP